MMKELIEKPEEVRKSIHSIIIAIFILFLIFIIGFLFYYKWILETPVSSSNNEVLFEIKNGESTFTIANRLQKRGVIRSDWAFYLDCKIKTKTLLPGVYELSPNMPIRNIISKISTGDTKLVKVTIPEGYRVEQIGQLLSDKKIADYGKFVASADQYEGKLFPDTYYLSPDKTIDQIISMMLKDYKDRIETLNVTDEDLIIASIVEREAINDEERPLIAGIYKNRLKNKMKLEADPTVQYGKDSTTIFGMTNAQIQNFKFWQPITTADYRTVNSPFNTYLVSGLPKGPICNPGLKSIEATINYEISDYIYFLQKDGKIYPSKTLEEHNKNRVNILGAKS